MGNEKNFLITVIITLAILISYPLVAQKFFPQYFAEKSATEVRYEELMPAETKNSAPDAVATTIETAGATASIKTEKTYIIENDKFTIVISGDNADIQSLGLKTFRNPATGLPEEFMGTSLAQKGVLNTGDLTDNAALEQVIPADQSIRFIFRDKDLIISKTIGFADDGYGIECQIGLTNEGDKDISLAYNIVAAHKFSSAGGMEGRYNEAVIMLQDKKMSKKNVAGINKESQVSGDARFAGIKSRYFSTLLIPSIPISYAYYSGFSHEKGRDTTVGMRTKETVIGPQQEAIQKYILYAGPNIHDDMAAFKSDIEYVRGRGIMAGLSEILLLLLRFLYRVFKNYGVAVIGLSLLTNLALYPLTFKSLSSMKEMQAVQPLVEKLRVEYKDNQQKLNKEIMELYKKHKVNPAGGCLPMLFQMPAFFALYGVLMSAIELRGAAFLWIKDLSSPDALVTFPSTYPFIGNTLNVLPLVMVVVSFIQQKKTTPSQGNDQQKMMATIMPVMLGFIFYNFPSGLVLYFLTNTLFSFVVQLRLNTAHNKE